MGKPTGFMEYKREVSLEEEPKKRIEHFNEFHEHLPKEKQQLQGARCMECGVPFCQAGMMICGMASGCPLHNLVPEWNDPCLYRKLGAGVQPSEKDEQFPGIYFQSLPCSLRGSLYLRIERGPGIHEGK